MEIKWWEPLDEDDVLIPLNDFWRCLTRPDFEEEVLHIPEA